MLVSRNTHLYPMDKWSKQEHKQLNSGHTLVEQFGTCMLILLQQGTAVLRARPS